MYHFLHSFYIFFLFFMLLHFSTLLEKISILCTFSFSFTFVHVFTYFLFFSCFYIFFYISYMFLIFLIFSYFRFYQNFIGKHFKQFGILLQAFWQTWTFPTWLKWDVESLVHNVQRPQKHYFIEWNSFKFSLHKSLQFMRCKELSDGNKTLT